MIITEEYREAAKQQSAADRERNKKDSAAIARLQKINDQQRAEREANKQFIEQFEECCKPSCYNRRPATPHDLWTLVNVLTRLSTDQTQLYKRALKLRYCLKVKGWEPKSVGDVLPS